MINKILVVGFACLSLAAFAQSITTRRRHRSRHDGQPAGRGLRTSHRQAPAQASDGNRGRRRECDDLSKPEAQSAEQEECLDGLASEVPATGPPAVKPFPPATSTVTESQRKLRLTQPFGRKEPPRPGQ